IGMPECRITLSQAVTYLALAPKSNAAYTAIDEALTDVREGRTIPVPMHLRDSHSSPVNPAEQNGAQPRAEACTAGGVLRVQPPRPWGRHGAGLPGCRASVLPPRGCRTGEGSRRAA